MKRFVTLLLTLSCAFTAYAEPTPVVKNNTPKTVTAKKKTAKYKPVKLKTEDDKALYGVGLVIARQLEVFELSANEFRIVRQGIYDGVKGKKQKVDFTEYSKKSAELGIARRNARGEKLLPLVPAFMTNEAAKEGAIKKESGLIYQTIQEGEGTPPLPTDKIKVHYRATLIDGKEVVSTYKTGQPDELVLSEFMKCLSEGIQMMKQGGKARLICPPQLALGKEGDGIIPPDATLVFEVELLNLKK